MIKLCDFTFYFGIVFAILCIIGYTLSKYHPWLDGSMVGVAIFLCSIIDKQKKEKKEKSPTITQSTKNPNKEGN